MTKITEALLINIFSFSPSFVFYSQCKTILNYSNQYSIILTRKYYFDEHEKLVSVNYVFLDYFLFHKHLLILDNYKKFEDYLGENCWAKDLCNKNPDNKIISESLRNIMRLSYFVTCLRELAKYQRKKITNKIEQTNIGISFQYLIESVNKESEEQVKMLKHYISYS